MGARATPFAQPTMKLIIVALVLSAAIVAALPARFGEADPDAIVPEDSFESTVDSILMQGPAKAAPRGGKNGKADDHKPNGKKDDHKPTGKGSEKKADGAASNHAHKKPKAKAVLVASKHAKGAQGHGSEKKADGKKDDHESTGNGSDQKPKKGDHKPDGHGSEKKADGKHSNHKPPITNHHPHKGDHTKAVLVASKHKGLGKHTEHKSKAA